MAYKNAQSKAATKYNKASTVGLTIRLNNKTDSDIIAELSTVKNKSGLIKTLLRLHGFGDREKVQGFGELEKAGET